MNKQAPSFKEEMSKFGKAFLGIFRAIPKWIYITFIPLVVGIAITSMFFLASENSNKDIPKTQIINDQNITFTYAYDGRTKSPLWVLEVMRPADAHGKMENVKFSEDKLVPPIIRSMLTDFKNSGFDAAPLVDASRDVAVPLSVASPLLPQFNRIYWEKVDHYAKDLLKKLEVIGIIVISGPLYLSHAEKDGKKYVTYQVLGENNVAVPTHLFKVIFYPVQNPEGSDYSMNSEIYIVPNENLNEETPLETFRTSLENFEKMSGIVV
jgi:endonuclease G, mitochondrial